MSPEEREILEKTLRLAEENNKLLSKIRRNMVLSSATRWIYWLVILGLSFGAYYFIQPYMDMLKDGLGISSGGISSPTPIEANVSVLKSALENLKEITR
jgi:hypothetical protein